MKCKKIAAIGMSALLALSAFPVTAFADEEETEVIKAYRFDSPCGTLYFSDLWFDGSGTVLNEHLRTTSMALTGSTNGTASDPNGDAGTILRNSGFEMDAYTAEGTDGNSDPHGIGSVISYKVLDTGKEDIDDEDRLIAVSVRPIDYGAEWASNLDVGTEGDAKGFKESADIVIERLLDFEEKYDLAGSKIWLTGFSRSGAVIDQVGKYINEHLDQFGITEDDLYAYTFATPRTSVTATQYSNIHDFIDVNDPVTYVLPEAWGMYTTGTVTEVDCGDSDVTRMYLSFLAEKKVAVRTEKATDPETGEEVDVPVAPYNCGELCKAVFDALTDKTTREEFASLSPVFDELMPMFIGDNADPAILLFLAATARNAGLDFTSPLVSWLLNAISQTKGTEGYDAAFALLPGVLDSTVEAAGTKAMISEEKLKLLENGITKVLYHLLPVVVADLTNGTDLTATVIGQAKEIIKHHSVDHYMELLRDLDSNYTRKVTVENGSVVDMVKNETYSDLDEIRAMGLSEEELKKIENGYSIYCFTNTEELKGQELTEAQIDDICQLFDGIGTPKSYSLFRPTYNKYVEFEDVEALESDETMASSFAVQFSSYPDILNENISPFIVKIDGSEMSIMSCTVTEDPSYPDSVIITADYDFSEDDSVIYGLVIVDTSKEPEESEPETQPDDTSKPESQPDDTSKPDEKGDNPKTGAAFAGGIVVITLAAAIFAGRKRRS